MKPQASISTDTQSPLPTIPAEVTQPVQEVTPMEDEMTTPVSVTPEAMPSTTSPSSQSAQ